MAKTLLISQFPLGPAQFTLNNAITKDQGVSLPGTEWMR